MNMKFEVLIMGCGFELHSIRGSAYPVDTYDCVTSMGTVRLEYEDKFGCYSVFLSDSQEDMQRFGMSEESLSSTVISAISELEHDSEYGERNPQFREFVLRLLYSVMHALEIEAAGHSHLRLIVSPDGTITRLAEDNDGNVVTGPRFEGDGSVSQLKTLVKCAGCHDCADCVQCVDCVRCSECVGCIGCVGCNRLADMSQTVSGTSPLAENANK